MKDKISKPAGTVETDGPVKVLGAGELKQVAGGVQPDGVGGGRTKTKSTKPKGTKEK